MHLIVGVSTLFATKVDTFPRDRESCLLLCAVSTTECGFGKSSYLYGQRWHILWTSWTGSEMVSSRPLRPQHVRRGFEKLNTTILCDWVRIWSPSYGGKMKMTIESLKMTNFDVIKCLKFGKVWLHLCGRNLANLDWVLWILVNSCLISPFFSRAKLQQADFTGAELDGTNICNANLLSCSFTGAEMKGAIFARANPKNACLMDSSFCNADLQSAHLRDANLSNTSWEMNLEEANLKGIKLNGANLQGTNLQWAYLRDLFQRYHLLLRFNQTSL